MGAWRTSHPAAPWRVVHSDHKKVARLELLRDLLASFDYPKKHKAVLKPDRDVAFLWNENAASEGKIAP